ncbi:uncharacterized protein LOC108161119 [Drosophila miranda]|uniref:uncharacterized protein LOC108161119 n=1 Tax=Drosophila miranda TaxID=7229 RepID=UPI00143FAC8E|nr:uncharacterized protein LOC108161119 [Drosophila miranda]
MKIFVALLAFVAFASAASVGEPIDSQSISSTIEDLIHGIQEQMPCGFAGLGIPPLAPLRIDHKNIDIDTSALKAKGSIDHFRLNGMDDFEIDEMKVNALTSKVTYKFTFRNVNVDTSYDLTVLLKKFGFTINLIGAGHAKFAIKDMVIWGTLKYSLGVLSGKLTLKSLEVRTHLGEVDSEIEGILGDGAVNEKMNLYLAEPSRWRSTRTRLKMKSCGLIAVLLALALSLGHCQGAEVAEPLAVEGRSVSSEILELLEVFRGLLETGYGPMPKLAPAEIKHQAFQFSTGEFSANGEINDFVLEGLNGFEVIIMNVDLIRSRVDFELNFGSINFTTLYQADVGSGYRMKREGGAYMALEDFNLKGRISYSLGVISSQMKVKSILVYPSVGNVASEIENLSKYRIFNRKLNEIVEEFITLTVNENTDFVANWLNEMVTPLCNELIGDRSLSDLIGIITGAKN